VIEEPQITAVPAQLTALIHVTIPRSEIRAVMGPGIGELMAVAGAQGIGPAGPWFTHHLKMDPEVFDFEICVAVTAPVAAAGRVVAGQRPAVKVARTVYHGPYEGLAGAWGEFKKWIAANGHAQGQDLYECYVVGPESSSNPADWRTELTQPLI
jgi:effector-binding domain-containing protein